MLITTQDEIKSLMPTAKWGRVEDLMGWLEEEERVKLVPLLGSGLYHWLLTEYVRLRDEYLDITAATVRPTGTAKADPVRPHLRVTGVLDSIASGNLPHFDAHGAAADGQLEVNEQDMATIQLIRICQQITFYSMLAHKAGMLAVSFNEGGGFNRSGADDYDPADDKFVERLTKDAWMSAGRSVDSLLLFLEDDAKGEGNFTEKWREADAFYLHKDLLFATARVMQEYLSSIKCRMDYVAQVSSIRYVQHMMIKPRVGSKLLRIAIASEQTTSSDEERSEVYAELLTMLRQAAAFYVEGKDPKLARQESNLNGQQALEMACNYIEENLDVLGDDAVGSPVYKKVQKAKEAEEVAKARRDMACRRGGRREYHANDRDNALLSFGSDATGGWIPEQE